MDNLDRQETVGLGQMVDKVSGLAREAMARVGTIDLPPDAVPPGLVVDKPVLVTLIHGDGRIELKDISPFIEGLRGKPVRRKGTATTATLDSFCTLVNRNGDDETVIFADTDWRKPKLTAVLNYHRRLGYETPPLPAQEDGDDPLARFGDHRVVYAFPLSEPWKIWVDGNGKFMGQAEFAAFLEEHIHEIAAPDTDPDGPDVTWERTFRTKIAQPNELVDLARGMEIHVGAKVVNKVRLQTGETAISFETEHRTADGRDITVPGLFLLRLPIFYRGLHQRMLVRLRYRVKDGAILWAYELHRPDEVVDERVGNDLHEVESRTQRTVIVGSPETGA